MATAKDQLNRYFEMIDRRVPTRVSQFIRWLRKPSSFAVRLVVALLLPKEIGFVRSQGLAASVRQMLAITNAKFGANSDFTFIAKVLEEWAGVEMRG